MLSQRLVVGVAQKQILTPGLVQLVTVLQLNRLELKDMIAQEVAQNPVLEESLDPSEELTPAELQEILERERVANPADQELLTAAGTEAEFQAERSGDAPETLADEPAAAATTDPFDEIDFDNYFNEYLEPGFKSPAGENPEKPSWETFASAPVTLGDHLRSQLSLLVMPEEVRDACESVIGNLDDNGYITATAEEIASYGDHTVDDVEKAIEEVQSLDPAGVGARNVRECLLLQLENRRAMGSVAWQILDQHMNLLEGRQYRELAKLLRRPIEHVQVAVEAIKHLDPRPGLRYSGPGARTVEPDVYIYKDGDSYHVELNDDDMPQLRLNRQYIRMLDREQQPDKDVRNYVKDRFNAASMLLKNIEQRKQTILKVCHCVIDRQREFLELGLDYLRPMMIKELAEEIGVHASTVSRAVAGKYAHTPQGVFELRYFFSEAVQGPSGGSTSLQQLKRMVKKMIGEEDRSKPLTDDQIAIKLQAEGISVTRRTVAKYREDLKIPATHQRRLRD
jgi:RNA polymerase sigma-54 factor